MPTLTFKVDKERDIRNAWELCNLDTPFLENEEKKQLDSTYKTLWGKRSFEECREEIKLYTEFLYSSGIMDTFKEGVEKTWGKINDEYFNRLERITKTPICSNEFTAYTTTVGRCLYNINDFSLIVSIRRPLLQCLRTIGHELMHLQFHYNYWDRTEKEIGKEKTADLNESLTILLNLEFGDLWLVEDKGYDSHRSLRKFIYEEWKKEKDFGKLIESCIGHLK